MKTKIAVISLVLFFISNLYALLTALSTEKEQAILTASETIVIPNISSNLENTLQEDIHITNKLEPSTDINFEENREHLSNTEDVQEIITENFKASDDRVTDNETLIVPNDASTTEISFSSDVSIINKNEEILKISVHENIPENVSTNSNNTDLNDIPKDVLLEKDSTITERNKSGDTSEDIPSFSEWAQKRLEEVEKNEQINSSVKGINTNGKGQNAKLRWKNYASLDCGAKVISANPESVSPWAILSPSTDEYKLNPCTSRIWFVVELCEAIQIKKIDLANYELFSSSPKDFTVSVSDRFPSRDWSFIGKFTAMDERDIQSFDLDTHLFGKYIKVEIKSHYGSEHYCPISLFRAYGTSVFEVLQKEDPAHVNRIEDDDDDDDEDSNDSLVPNDDPQKNLFSSATDAVLSIVKRAAEVLGNKVNNQTSNTKLNETHILRNTCSSPRHIVVCNNCNESLFGQIYELISCKTNVIQKLVNIPYIYKTLVTSFTCQSYGIDLRNDVTRQSSNFDNLELFFPTKYLIAMCNEAAVLENQAILNISQQYLNITKDLSKEKIVNLDVGIPEIVDNKFNDTVENLLSLGNNTNNGSVKESEGSLYTAQIKPTKVFNSDPDIGQTMNLSDASKPEISTIENAAEKGDVLTPVQDVTESSVLAMPTQAITSESETVTEITESLDDHLEHIISDLNADGQSTSTPSSTATSTNSPPAPKESIFLRLSNRIKALERNMSLSSQYLEELSKRYKKQVEEMQHLLEKAIATLREDGIKRDERNRYLEERLDNLTTSMELLMAERQFLRSMVYLVICILLFSYGIYFFCGKFPSNVKSPNEKTSEILRRRSIDVLTHRPTEKKKRRPSDQVLKIVRHSSLIEDDKTKRPKKRKKSKLTRSSSVSGISKPQRNNEAKKNIDWVEENHKAVEDIPFALEESDLFTMEDCSLPSELKKESPTIQTLDSSQNYFEINKNSLPDNVKNIDECSITSNTNSTSTVISCSEPVKKEKKGIKKFFKKVF